MKKKFVGLLAILAIGLLLTGGLVSAFGPKGFVGDEELRQAIDDGDFQTWKELHEERLTEDNFAEIQERHQERQGKMQGPQEMRDAIETNDYEAYTDAVLEIHPEAIVLSQEDFNTLVAMHQAKLDGDMDTWKSFRDEVDFAPGEMMREHRGMGNGMGNRLGRGMGQGMHYAE